MQRAEQIEAVQVEGRLDRIPLLADRRGDPTTQQRLQTGPEHRCVQAVPPPRPALGGRERVAESGGPEEVPVLDRVAQPLQVALCEVLFDGFGVAGLLVRQGADGGPAAASLPCPAPAGRPFQVPRPVPLQPAHHGQLQRHGGHTDRGDQEEQRQARADAQSGGGAPGATEPHGAGRPRPHQHEQIRAGEGGGQTLLQRPLLHLARSAVRAASVCSCRGA
ncbi:hypothetical protein [Streptomyces sp. NPDC002078]